MRLLKLRLSKLRTAVVSVAVLALIATTAVVAVAQGGTSDWQAVRGEAITRIGSEYMGAERDQVADSIANDVTSRGTVWRFMLGSDSGVLYGVGPSAVQPEIQVQTRTTTPTRTETRTTPPENRLFGAGGLPDKTYIVGTAVKTIALQQVEDTDLTVTYTLTGAPSGWSVVLPDTDGTLAGALSGAPTAVRTHRVTLQATTADGKSDSLSFTVTIMRDEKPTLAPGPGDQRLVVNDEDVMITLPTATDKNAPMGAVTYSVTGQPEWLTLDANTGILTIATVPDLPGATFIVTFTAMVADVLAVDDGTDGAEAGDNNSVSGTFTITIVPAPNGG